MPSHTTHMTYASGSQMPHRDLRPLPGVERLFERAWADLAERLDDPGVDRNDTCRDAIAQLYGVQLQDGWVEDESIPLATRAMMAPSTRVTLRSSPSITPTWTREGYAG